MPGTVAALSGYVNCNPSCVSSNLSSLTCCSAGIKCIDLPMPVLRLLTRNAPKVVQKYVDKLLNSQEALTHEESETHDKVGSFLSVTNRKGASRNLFSVQLAARFHNVVLDHNNITLLLGAVQFCNVTRLSLQDNVIETIEACEPLSLLPRLQWLSMVSNPVTKCPNYRPHLLRICSWPRELTERACRLKVLDELGVEGAEVQQAVLALKLENTQFPVLRRRLVLLLFLQDLIKKKAMHKQLMSRRRSTEWVSSSVRRVLGVVEPAKMGMAGLYGLLRAGVQNVFFNRIDTDTMTQTTRELVYQSMSGQDSHSSRVSESTYQRVLSTFSSEVLKLIEQLHDMENIHLHRNDMAWSFLRAWDSCAENLEKEEMRRETAANVVNPLYTSKKTGSSSRVVQSPIIALQQKNIEKISIDISKEAVAKQQNDALSSFKDPHRSCSSSLSNSSFSNDKDTSTLHRSVVSAHFQSGERSGNRHFCEGSRKESSFLHATEEKSAVLFRHQMIWRKWKRACSQSRRRRGADEYHKANQLQRLFTRWKLRCEAEAMMDRPLPPTPHPPHRLSGLSSAATSLPMKDGKPIVVGKKPEPYRYTAHSLWGTWRTTPSPHRYNIVSSEKSATSAKWKAPCTATRTTFCFTPASDQGHRLTELLQKEDPAESAESTSMVGCPLTPSRGSPEKDSIRSPHQPQLPMEKVSLKPFRASDSGDPLKSVDQPPSPSSALWFQSTPGRASYTPQNLNCSVVPPGYDFNPYAARDVEALVDKVDEYKSTISQLRHEIQKLHEDCEGIKNRNAELEAFREEGRLNRSAKEIKFLRAAVDGLKAKCHAMRLSHGTVSQDLNEQS